jgi:hypothetical protein
VGSGARQPMEPDAVLSHDTSARRLKADPTCDATRTVHAYHPSHRSWRVPWGLQSETREGEEFIV